MSSTITQVKEHLIGMGHGGTLNKVRNQEALFERAINTVLSKIDPVDTERTAALASTVHDDFYNYALPSDYKKIIDLIPQDNRTSLDTASRQYSGAFDLKKDFASKTLSIEGTEGTKFIRINWRSRQGKTLNAMDSVTANGTWSAVGTATGIAANTIFKVTGNASIEFDLVASGDGIQNTTMTAVDLTNEDEVADVFVWVYLGAAPTSITAVWGNDLTTKYWTAVAQTTQADGTAFKVGWNLLKFPWSTATETGTVAPATIDSFKLTVAKATALANIRVDNIVFSIGRNFDLKYYSQFAIKNSAGTWLARTTSDDDTVVFSGTALNIFLMECVIAMAQQVEGADSKFDIDYAKGELEDLYKRYRAEYPSQSKKATTNWFGLPRFQR